MNTCFFLDDAYDLLKGDFRVSLNRHDYFDLRHSIIAVLDALIDRMAFEGFTDFSKIILSIQTDSEIKLPTLHYCWHRATTNISDAKMVLEFNTTGFRDTARW